MTQMIRLATPPGLTPGFVGHKGYNAKFFRNIPGVNFFKVLNDLGIVASVTDRSDAVKFAGCLVQVCREFGGSRLFELGDPIRECVIDFYRKKGLVLEWK